MSGDTLSRRQFIQICAVAGAAAGSVWLGLKSGDHLPVVKETRMLMGTLVNLQVAGEDSEAAQGAVSACFGRMQTLENLLSRYRPDSQVSVLNRTGILAEAHPALVTVVKESAEISRRSFGAFDITVKPLLDLYQHHWDSESSLPTHTEVKQCLELVGHQNIAIDGNALRFLKAGMAITLDGIAKGFIVDQGVSVLRKAGFGNVLVEAGGDLSAAGQNSVGHPWKIGVQSPRNPTSSTMANFELQDRAAATSGDYMSTFSEDYSQHHIIDPRTGFSAPDLASVTVTAPTALLADTAATAVMVLGPIEGLNFLERDSQIEGFLVDKNQRTIRSSGF